jgi:hypothetical protein
MFDPQADKDLPIQKNGIRPGIPSATEGRKISELNGFAGEKNELTEFIKAWLFHFGKRAMKAEERCGSCFDQ